MIFSANLSTLRIESRPFASGELNVAQDDIVGIFGRNGVGKTTVMRALSGLGDAPMSRSHNHRLMDSGSRYVNIVFQKDNLIPWLTVRDNLALSKPIFGPRREDEVGAYLQKFALEDLADRWPRSLSGGETKLVELARACRKANPGIIILDEPFTGLDFEFQIKVEDFILRELSEMYSGIIVVSHELMRLAAITTKVYVFLRPGDDDPLEVLEVRRDAHDTTRAYREAIAEAFGIPSDRLPHAVN